MTVPPDFEARIARCDENVRHAFETMERSRALLDQAVASYHAAMNEATEWRILKSRWGDAGSGEL